ncbi:MAG: putative toxin-antitoxin system toxin component, PIN family [Acidobacteriota bacterium]|nr:putative toxin-antitoxin system toxin component, PIN family [Acidobacteriota bacterium]
MSAALFPTGVAARAYLKAVYKPNDAIISDYVIDEMRSVFARKFPDRLAAVDAFLVEASSALEVVSTPVHAAEGEESVRDAHDRPILRAARAARADVILSGDKDLPESGISSPRIVTASEFLAF